MSPSQEAEREFGRWTYGDAGDVYPVVRGDIWTASSKMLAHHLFCCGDLEAGDWDRFHTIAGAERAALCYVDPPWNAGNAASFRTKAGVSRRVDFPSFLASVVRVVSSGSADELLCEMGEAEVPRLFQVLDDARLRVYQTWGITYYQTNPCRLVYAGPERGPRLDPNTVHFEGMDDERTPGLACHALASKIPGALVIDPCCGRGLTAVATHSSGLRFAGMELHPRRMAVGLAKLAALGLNVWKVGNLNEGTQ